ncbi:MAG TPA: phage/plasmid primase, P4 family [Thermoguttaceae bacterium]|nr:phage/plasmid primase, P4 family [Thermoguttaceae bacterium]
MNRQIELVVGRLRSRGMDPVQNNGGWLARCPNCDDPGKRHLYVKVGDKQPVIVACQHQNCKIEDVLARLDLELKDISAEQPKPTRKTRREYVCGYDYRNANGDLVYQVQRVHIVDAETGERLDKDFPQRRPDPEAPGRWINNVKGVPRVLYRLPELLAADVGEWCFVCEGEKDVETVAGLNLCSTCNPTGAMHWNVLSDDSALHGRRACIIADRDDKGRRHAQDVAQRLAGKAALVKVIELPGDGVKDATDWADSLDAQDGEVLKRALLDMADAAEAYKPTAGAADSLIVEDISPIPLADLYLKSVRKTRLVRWRGQFYTYTGTHFAELSDEALECELYRYLDNLRLKPTKKDGREAEPVKLTPRSSLVREVRLALPSRVGVYLSDATDAPAWLNGRVEPKPRDLIACQNGLLDLATERLLPHDPGFFTVNGLPYSFDAQAPQPSRWLQFLDELFGNDEQSKEALQELFGYYLSSDSSQQKIGMIVGPKRGGKGTIGRVLTAMLGQENVCAPTLASLGMNFGLQPMLHKRLAVVSDARLSGRSDQAVITERLLSISGEDALTVDRKHLSSWTGRLPTRFLILTSELPRLTDMSGAMAGRFVLLCLTRSWYGEEDTRLTEKLLAELPGILNWAIVGYRALASQGRFTAANASADAMRELEDLASPISAFIRDRCNVGPGNFIEANRLYGGWKAYCGETGREHTGTRQAFGRDLRTVLPGLSTSMPRQDDGRVRCYMGIDLAV